MKQINFFFNHNPEIKWNPFTVLNGGLGGNYVAIMNVMKTMAKNGYKVRFFGFVNKEDIYDGVEYRDISTLQKSPDLGECDIFISCESGYPFNYIKANKAYNWIHRNIGTSISMSDKFDGHIVASQFHKDYLENHLKGRKTFIIPNGVDIELFNSDILRKRGLNSLVYVGHPMKGMKYLIDFKQRFQDLIPKGFEYSVHTYGNAELWGWDQDQFTKLQGELIKSRIQYHGRRGHKELSRFLKNHQIFLYTTVFYEPFGMAVLEGMACGLIPIVPNIGNLPEIVGNAGYVIDGNPKEFGWMTNASEKVLDLMKNPDKMSDMSILARRTAEKYTWEKAFEIWDREILT